MRILMTFLGYIGNGSSMSGGDTYFIEISRRLLKRHDVTVLTTPNGAILLNNQKLMTNIIIISFPFIGRVPWFFDYFLRALFIFFKFPSLSQDFNVVISTSPLLPDIITTAVISTIKKIRPVIYHHGFTTPIMVNKYNFVLRFFNIAIQRRLLTWILKRFSFVIFALPMAKDDLTILGVPEEHILGMINGIDTTAINLTEAKNYSFEGVFMGSIIPRKGVFDLPDIWRKVVDKFPNAKLAVLGTGPPSLLNKLKHEIEVKKLQGNIFFIGSILGQEKYAILKSSKVFVFPSYSESWAISVSEAMYCGLACVLYNSEAYDAYLDGVLEVPVGDKEEFAETIINLFSNENRRSEIANKAKIIASKFDWEKIVLAHTQNLNKIVIETEKR